MPVILIVDDLPANIKVLEAALESTDFTLCSTTRGSEAIALADAVQPDLILLDIMMPGMNGFEVCERLKASSRTAHIPVIFLSALNDPEDRIRGLSVGGEDFIPKPVSMDEVVARVRIHLSLHAQYQELMRLRTQEQQDHEQLERLRVRLFEQIRHDVRNQMANLGVLLHLLKRSDTTPENPRTATYFERAQGVLMEIAQTLEILLRIPEPGSTAGTSIRAVKIQPFLEKALLVYQFVAEARGIALEICIQQIREETVVYVDADRLHTAVINLIDNALRHTPAGGTVRLRAIRTEQALIIEVEDTGCGISATEQSRIFDRYYRGTNNNDEVSGQGLGLAIVHSVVETHGGKISVQSELGKGTCFSLSLPQPTPVEADGFFPESISVSASM